MLAEARRELKNAQTRAEARADEHQDALRALQAKLETQTSAADTLQALLASTGAQLSAAFPTGPLLDERERDRETKTEKERDIGSRTPPYASSSLHSSTPLTLTATARRLALPHALSGDRDDPVKCVETVFSTCKALQDRAAYWKNDALKLRETLKHNEAT